MDGFASGRITPLATRQVASPRGKEKARMLPWDAAPPAPPSSSHGKGTRPRTGTGGRCCLAAYAGDGESYLEKSLRGETAAFAETAACFWERGGEGREEGRELEKRRREREAPCQGCNTLQDVELLVSLAQCIILQRNGPFPIERHQNLNYIYIIITIAIYLSIYIYICIH